MACQRRISRGADARAQSINANGRILAIKKK
jgi:hypothetical protein